MTSILAFVLSLFLGSQAAQNPQAPPFGGTATLSGQVVSLDGGKPIPNALLRLVRWEGGRGSQTSLRSDAQGHFEFAKLLAGQYQLNVSAERYLSLEFGQRGPLDTGRRIDLADGQVFDKANFSLPRTSAIEGQLLDEFGDPAPGVTVQVARVDFVMGARRLIPVGTPSGNRPTDDLGKFRIFNLPPGDYYLLALSGPFVLDQTQGDSAGFAPTYFPGTTIPTDAQAVHLGVSQDVTGLSFALHPAAMATLAGRAVDDAGKPIANGVILLAQMQNNDVLAQIAGHTSSAADGAFQFRNVAPGAYVVQGYGPGALARAAFGYATVTADGKDRTDLQLTLLPGRVARGRFIIDGDPSTIRPAQVIVFPRPVDFVSGPLAGGGLPPTEMHDDWTFEVSNMSGRRAMIMTLPQGWAVKRVTLDGRDITDEPVDFSAGDVNGIEITLTNKISTISGSATDAGKAVTDYTVLVFSENAEKWKYPSRFIGMSRSSPQGSFKILGLPAGRYLAVALNAAPGNQWQSPEFLTKMRALATPFTLSDAENLTLLLKLVK